MIALGIIILALGGYLVYALIYPEKAVKNYRSVQRMVDFI